jgi:hypothetical protein
MVTATEGRHVVGTVGMRADSTKRAMGDMDTATVAMDMSRAWS